MPSTGAGTVSTLAAKTPPAKCTQGEDAAKLWAVVVLGRSKFQMATVLSAPPLASSVRYGCQATVLWQPRRDEDSMLAVVRRCATASPRGPHSLTTCGPPPALNLPLWMKVPGVIPAQLALQWSG